MKDETMKGGTMIRIETNPKIIIDGADVGTLREICAVVWRFIEEGEGFYSTNYNMETATKHKNFIDIIKGS